MPKRVTILYFLSFLEGSAVMITELLGAKILAPMYGTSLYVWASVLGITLMGLASGYLAGGRMAERADPERKLLILLVLSASYLILMPFAGKFLLLLLGSLPLMPAVILSALGILFVPVCLLGMVSPLMVAALASHENRPGRIAGNVFAISTVGGILFTFLAGFIFLPEYGITKTALATGCILGIFPLTQLFGRSKKVLYTIPIFLIGLYALFTSASVQEKSVQYVSEGLLGQIVVKDYDIYDSAGAKAGARRVLLVNRSSQAFEEVNNDGSVQFFGYVHLIIDRSKVIDSPHQKKALVLGLGGGSICKELVRKGYDVDAVELDSRIAYCAKKFFQLPPGVDVHVDDARHWLHSASDHNFDLIVLDAFAGEVNPHHLFTHEFFSEIKSKMAANGQFIINGNGYWEGADGLGSRSIARTLIESGFDVEVVPTHSEPDLRNLIYFASLNETGRGILTGLAASEMGDALVMNDDHPVLEKLNAGANRRWRKICKDYFMNDLIYGNDSFLFY